MMEMGSHDPIRDVANIRRDNIPTLAEVKAAVPMVTTAEGTLVPTNFPDLADPDDRDSGQAAELAELVRQMDDLAREVVFNDLDGMARVLADQWQKIRKITQSNQPKGN